jgi:hypothetical protein
MGLPTDDHLSRAEQRRVRRDVFATDECLLMRNAVCLVQRTQRGAESCASCRRGMISINDDAPQDTAARCFLLSFFRLHTSYVYGAG